MPLGDDFDAILAAAQTGAEWAITEIYREFYGAILRFLRAGAPDEAEDLASQVWLEAATGLIRFEGDESQLRSWLFTIAARRLSNWRRQQGRHRTDPVDMSSMVDLAGDDDPERTVEAALAGDRAARLVAELLPPEQAEIVLLRVVAGLDVDEVAAITGRRPGTVRVLQHRALKRLARQLGSRANDLL